MGILALNEDDDEGAPSEDWSAMATVELGVVEGSIDKELGHT